MICCCDDNNYVVVVDDDDDDDDDDVDDDYKEEKEVGNSKKTSSNSSWLPGTKGERETETDPSLSVSTQGPMKTHKTDPYDPHYPHESQQQEADPQADSRTARLVRGQDGWERYCTVSNCAVMLSTVACYSVLQIAPRTRLQIEVQTWQI